jgi:hypothetical protein
MSWCGPQRLRKCCLRAPLCDSCRVEAGRSALRLRAFYWLSACWGTRSQAVRFAALDTLPRFFQWSRVCRVILVNSKLVGPLLSLPAKALSIVWSLVGDSCLVEVGRYVAGVLLSWVAAASLKFSKGRRAAKASVSLLRYSVVDISSLRRIALEEGQSGVMPPRSEQARRFPCPSSRARCCSSCSSPSARCVRRFRCFVQIRSLSITS